MSWIPSNVPVTHEKKDIFERILFWLQSQEAKTWKTPDLRVPESLTQCHL